MSEETNGGSNRDLTKAIRARLNPLLKEIETDAVPARLIELAQDLQVALDARKKAD